MARKSTKKEEQPKAAVENGAQQEGAKEQTKKSVSVVTTEGNTLDRIRIFQNTDGGTMVQADYGKLKPEGKTTEEQRVGMHTQLSRPLTTEQAQEYQRLYAEDPAKAKEYAVKTAYPMHVDDAAFHQKTANINGRDVNYITIEKITSDSLLLNAMRKEGMDVDHMSQDAWKTLVEAMSPEAKEQILSGQEGLIGKWQLAFGEKGKPETRFFGIMNREELANIRHRAEVTLDEKGQVKSVGASLTMADIAGKMEQRVLAQRQENEAKLDAAKKVDWTKFKLPTEASVTDLRYANAKEHPDRVWLSGKVNGIEVLSLLSKNETTAVKNKLATLEQVAAANKGFGEKMQSIINSGESKTVAESDVVKAVIDRASDSTRRPLRLSRQG